jgi:hypothetical protein
MFPKKNTVSVKKYPVFNSLRCWLCCKYFQRNGLAADISQKRTYGDWNWVEQFPSVEGQSRS